MRLHYLIVLTGFCCARGVIMPAPAAAALQAPVRAGDAAYASAAALVTQQKWSEAAAALEKFLSAHPAHPQAVAGRIALGDAMLGLEKPAPALAAFQAALAEKPADPLRGAALYGSARAHVALKSDLKALEALTEAFRLTEYDEKIGPPAAALLGDVLSRLEKYADAGKAYYRVTRWVAHPEAPRAYFMLAESYRLGGNGAEAALTFRNMAAKYPRHALAPQAVINAAEQSIALGRTDEAERDYQGILRIYGDGPFAPLAQMGLGRAALLQGRHAVARSAYQAAALLYPAAVGAEAELRIADCFVAERDWVEGKRRYEALQDSPVRSVAMEARCSLGGMLVQEGALTAAARLYEKVAQDPAAGRWSVIAGLRLAAIRTESGDPAAAVALLRPIAATAVAGAALRDEASLLLGSGLVRLSDFAAAEKELSGLLQRSPSGPFADAASAHLARCRLEQKDAAGARDRMTALLKKELPPDTRAGALTVLGQAQLRLREAPAGIASLREVLDRYPDQGADAAYALLAHYRESKQPAPAQELQALIDKRYTAAGAAMDGVLSRAEGALRSGRVQDAAGDFARVLDGRADRTGRLRALAGLAEIAGLERKPAEAEARLADIARAAPPAGFEASARARVGEALEKSGDSEAALAAYRGALAVDPPEVLAVDLMLRSARLHAAARRPGDGESLLRALVDRYPTSPRLPEALYSLAWRSLDADRKADARPWLLRLARDFPAHPLGADAAYRLGDEAFAGGDDVAAVGFLREAAKSTSPAGEAAGYRLGWALRRQGKHEEASRAFAAAAEAFPRGALARECRVRAGECCLELGRHSDALKQFDAALTQPAADSSGGDLDIQARVGAARACLAAGDTSRALSLASEAADPANGYYGGRAQLVRAQALLLTAGAAPALVELRRTLALYPRYRDLAAEAGFLAGECLLKLNDRAGAREQWQRVTLTGADTDWAVRSRAKLAELAALPETPPAARGPAARRAAHPVASRRTPPVPRPAAQPEIGRSLVLRSIKSKPSTSVAKPRSAGAKSARPRPAAQPEIGRSLVLRSIKSKPSTSVAKPRSAGVPPRDAAPARTRRFPPAAGKVRSTVGSPRKTRISTSAPSRGARRGARRGAG